MQALASPRLKRACVVGDEAFIDAQQRAAVADEREVVASGSDVGQSEVVCEEGCARSDLPRIRPSSYRCLDSMAARKQAILVYDRLIVFSSTPACNVF